LVNLSSSSDTKASGRGSHRVQRSSGPPASVVRRRTAADSWTMAPALGSIASSALWSKILKRTNSSGYRNGDLAVRASRVDV
jgi:hypothetical protein